MPLRHCRDLHDSPHEKLNPMSDRPAPSRSEAISPAKASGGAETSDDDRWRVLGLVCIAVVLSLTTWFSATAIIPELTRTPILSPTEAARLTNGVQVGFVIGAVAASLVSLPDIVPLNRLMAASALVAALANALLLVASGPEMAIVARIVTGIALAGVYPPALKLISTWFKTGRGFALGAVIGALTIGSAVPHLVRALAGGLDWRAVVVAASIATLVGAAMFSVIAREGPSPFSKAVFSPRQIGSVLTNKPLMLANLGYFGHICELYAFWGWFLAYASAALDAQGVGSPEMASLLTFGAVAIGVFGCLLGGLLSDRIGRTATTILMMAVSGVCALLIGFVFDGPTWLFVAVAAIWGIFVIANSAQFSAAVTEVGDSRFVGTALTLQMGIGFALTVVAIAVSPMVAGLFGSWRWTFLSCCPVQSSASWPWPRCGDSRKH